MSSGKQTDSDVRLHRHLNGQVLLCACKDGFEKQKHCFANSSNNVNVGRRSKKILHPDVRVHVCKHKSTIQFHEIGGRPTK